MSKRIVSMFLIMLTVLITASIVIAPASVPHNANSMWIEPSTIDLSSQSVGYLFNVTVYANVTSVPGATGAVGAWQFKMTYNNTLLNATKCVYKVGTTSGQDEFFQDIIVKTVTPKFGSNYVLFGDSWAGDPTTGPFATVPAACRTGGGLAIITFNLTSLVPLGGNATTTFDIATNHPSDTKILDYDSASDIGETVYNSAATIPVIPEFPIAAYMLIALIATSTLSLLIKKPFKRQKQ